MNVGSLFSGIGGLDHGLARAGHEHVFFCESDPWRRDVLAARWPGVPIYDDVREVDAPALQGRRGDVAAVGARADAERDGSPLPVQPEHVDLLCGGFPCQDLSVAGRRRGLAGDRSGLFFEFARIIEAFRPGWVLVENVPGLLSSNGGRDFGVVLGTLADLGYGVAWRVLDSRFFGVPQRRRRVFIVGALANGDPRTAAERAGQVLAVGSRCERHPAAGTKAGEEVAGTLGGGSGERGWPQDTERMTFVSHTLTAKRGKRDDGESETFVAAPLTKGSATGEGVNQPGRRQEDDVNIVAFDTYNQSVSEQTQTLRDPNGTFGDALPAVAYPLARRGRDGGSELEVGEPGVYNALRAGDGGSSRLNQVMIGTGVRRLTPRECERLQGLPDDWTLIDEKTPDSRRYSALGDAVTANVAEWIGRRLG